MKLSKHADTHGVRFPAAFGRLCVETSRFRKSRLNITPAAFGRLCVETIRYAASFDPVMPAAFGRLCVETGNIAKIRTGDLTSRLRAAVC